MESKIIRFKTRRRKGKIEQVFKNRRVVVSRCKDKNETQCFLLRFKVLTQDPSQRYDSVHIKEKIMQTSVALTLESTVALYMSLKEMLEDHLQVQ